MKRHLPALALLLGSCGLACAQSADETRLVDLLTQSRAGCTQAAGTQPSTLHWSAALARVAGRVQRGEKAADAINAEGYRAVRLVRSTVQADAAPEVARLVSKDNCGALTDPRVSDVAYVRTGNDWLVLLAAPLAMPQLADNKAVAQKVLALVNAARAQARACGADQFQAAEPLKWNARLEEAATAHAKEMAALSYLSVTGRDDSTPALRFASAGYRASKSTENVASGHDSPEKLVQQWLSEPEPCRNIMEPGFAEMAVAYDTNPASRSFVYWSLELAAPVASRGDARSGDTPGREAPKPEPTAYDKAMGRR